MLLTQREFDDRLRHGKLLLTLVGMSNIGKSYRSSMLAKEIAFKHVNCDDRIAARIADRIRSTDTTGVAEWMGQPYVPTYKEREEEYLGLEGAVVEQAIAEFTEGNTVIDSTGSVIYLSKDTQKKLQKQTLVVHLEADENLQEQLFITYMRQPKPVVWGTSFKKKADETDQDALARCYPLLLRARLKKYHTLADVTLPFAVARDKQADARKFLGAIRERLSTE